MTALCYLANRNCIKKPLVEALPASTYPDRWARFFKSRHIRLVKSQGPPGCIFEVAWLAGLDFRRLWVGRSHFLNDISGLAARTF